MSSLSREDWSQLITELRARQSEHWRKGERVFVEQLLSDYPELSREPDALLALVRSELQYRREAGEQPSFAEYSERFPEHAGMLRALWDDEPLSTSASAESFRTPFSHLPTRPWQATTANSDFTFAPAHPVLPGFELYEELGRGGMGIVYRARDTRLDQPRAIKFIRAGPFADPKSHDRFSREAKAVARLDHPGVVRIFALGEHGDTLFICMEFLEGGNLHAKLRQGAMAIRAAAELVSRLARAMQHAHDNNVLHRDLKPANVLLTADGIPKVSDFGLAKLLDEEEELTQVGAVMGTAAYMAPEQAESRLGEVREAADIWALGVILYQCLTGALPFVGTSRSDTLEAVKNRAPMPPRRLRADIPADLEAICLQCLRKQPQERYGSAAALADDLDNWLAGKSVSVSVRRRNGRSWATAIAAAVLLAGLGIGATALYRDRREPDNPAPAVAPAVAVWNALLAEAPAKLRWPRPGKNSNLQHFADKRELVVSCEQLGLLALGQTDAASYQIEATLAQNPWSGNIGLFFGYQEAAEKVQSKPGERFELLEIASVSTANQGQRFQAIWSQAFSKAGSNLISVKMKRAESALFDLTPTPHTFKIAVGAEGLSEVWLDGQRLAMSAAQPGNRPATGSGRGDFGIYIYTSNGVIRDAKYLFHEVPANEVRAR